MHAHMIILFKRLKIDNILHQVPIIVDEGSYGACECIHHLSGCPSVCRIRNTRLDVLLTISIEKEEYHPYLTYRKSLDYTGMELIEYVGQLVANSCIRRQLLLNLEVGEEQTKRRGLSCRPWERLVKDPGAE